MSMKSPDEIKKGLELCYEDIDCSECPYVDDCFGNDETPFGAVMPDALALIQQLEFQNGELLKTVEMLKEQIEEYEESADKCCYESQCNAELNKLEALCKRLMDENEQLEAERDAAVDDLEDYATLKCFACKYYETELTEAPCDECKIMGKGNRDKFEWRGVQKEE